MNIGSLFILIELLKDIERARPGQEGVTYEIKPSCGPGTYATKTAQGKWVCVPIPKGR